MKTFPMRTNKNLIVAETFLDMFGLSFDLDDSFRIGAYIPIMDSRGEKVGMMKISSYCETIFIEAETPLGSLSARFPIIYTTSIFLDTTTILFSAPVSYEILLTKGKNLKGECTIDFTTFEFDNLVGSARHKICLQNGERVEMKIETKDNSSFQATFFEGLYYENISFNLSPDSDKYITHSIEKRYPISLWVNCDKKDIETFDKDESKLHVYHHISENGEAKFLTGDYLDKKPRKEENSSQDDPFIIQLCTIMQELDPDLKERLASLRDSLNDGTTNFLDEILNTSLTGFTDNELEALFGFIPELEREPEKRYTFLPNQNC